MYVIRNYHEQVCRFICARSGKAFRWAWILIGVVVLLVAAAFLIMGAPPMNGLPWDAPILLDGTWRIEHGQTPHKDFFLVTGILPLYTTLLGMKLGQHGVSSITYGNILVMIFVGPIAMLCFQRRTSAFYACTFSLFLVLLAGTPRALGFPYDYTDYAMMYNRYGEVFLALLGALLFLRPEPGVNSARAEWVEAGCAGICLTMLLFCKMNYFSVGLGFFCLALLQRRFPWHHYLFAFLAAGALLGAVLLATKIPITAMWNDYHYALASQKFASRFDRLSVEAAKAVRLLPIFLFVAWEISNKPGEARTARWYLLLAAAIFSSELLLISTNEQHDEMPLLALAALAGAEIIRRQTRPAGEEGFFVAARNVGAAGLLMFFIMPAIATDFGTIGYAVASSCCKTYVTSNTLQSTNLKDWRFCVDGSRNVEMKQYMETVDEGIQLLRRHFNPQMRLDVLTFSDPFHIALNIPPAQGGVDCWSWIGLSKEIHPPLKRMIGNATHILAMSAADLDVKSVNSTYGPMVGCKYYYGKEWDDLRLEVVERTKHFALFKVPNPVDNIQ